MWVKYSAKPYAAALQGFNTENEQLGKLSISLQNNAAGVWERGALTVLLLGDEVVLGFDVVLERVEVLPLVLLDVGRHALQDVVGRGRAAARAALRAAGLRHVAVLVTRPVFLNGRRERTREAGGRRGRGRQVGGGAEEGLGDKTV